MEQEALIQKIESLENQVAELKKVHKKEHNSDVVYNTKDTMGYSQMVEASGGKMLFLSGMTPWDKEMKLKSNDLMEQLEHTMDNLLDLLTSKGLDASNLISLRMYVAKPNYYDDMPNFGPIILKKFGQKVETTMTLIGVTGLAEPDQLIEIEAIAVA